MASFLPQTLEVDEQIFDRNLKIVEDANQMYSKASTVKQRQQLLPEKPMPSVQVCPDPGMCVKTKNVAGQKVFVNLCKIQEIPPARPISEERLQEIILSEDYSSDYRVPMSLGAPRTEKDKSGKDCVACDVAVNSVWYDQTMENSLTFTTFVVGLAMEGLCEKYGDECNVDRQNWSILKNKRYMGKIQRHVIQQRPGITGIQEIQDNSTTNLNEKVVKIKPEFEIVKADEEEFLVATIMLPKVQNLADLSLDLGEDRLVLEARNAGYVLDIFLPYNLCQDECGAQFHRDKKVLTVTMPLLQSNNLLL